MLRVYDLSHWNGDIDYRLVKASGVAAAIVAAGDGCNFFDPKFEENCEGACLLNPKRLDIYRYLRLGWFDPESHADVCLRDIERAKRINPNVRLWLDWEDPSDQCAAMTVLQRQQWASEFLDSLEDNGPPDLSYGHYTRASWFDPMMGLPTGKLGQWVRLSKQFFDHPLWVAHYMPVTEGRQPTLPKGWSDWLVWQYSSEGQVPGIPNAFTDLNWAKPEFIGQEDDMADNPFIFGRLKAEQRFGRWMSYYPLNQGEKDNAERQDLEEDAFRDFVLMDIEWRLPMIGKRLEDA
jgi:GH25 family lysozyme M1 (1,4-beta-N-acetylmuramidase)